MMLSKALTKSGRKILKAIKKISTGRLAKKLQQQQLEQQQQQQQQRINWFLQTRLYEHDRISVISSSLPSLDAKSVDTFVTYVAEGGGVLAEGFCYVPHCCCHCDEREENQLNENLENEMMR